MNAEMILTLLGYIFALVVLSAMLVIALATILVLKHRTAFKSQWDLVKRLPNIIQRASDKADSVYVFINNNWPQIESYVISKNVERVNLEKSFEALKNVVLNSDKEFTPEQLVALNKIVGDVMAQNSGKKEMGVKLDFLGKYLLELGERIRNLEGNIELKNITERKTEVRHNNQADPVAVVEEDQFKTLVGGSPKVDINTARLNDPMSTVQMRSVSNTANLPVNIGTDKLPDTGKLVVGEPKVNEELYKTQVNAPACETVRQRIVNIKKE